ncbi:NUDIX domain-containing protein [Eubacteriales bacterium OttesenSCG-928-A19]|nr:NUDIX domain-containing protein [Eubacteriales bacterium OttesenSCG-928-A19]
MNIRSAAKAVILRDEQVLLVQCESNGTTYYDLPGGGQNAMETMEEAVVRECLEETGYAVRVIRCLALLEEILVDEALAVRYPNYVHRIFHVFLCEIDGGVPRAKPSEADFDQVGLRWVPLAHIASLPLRPAAIRRNLATMLRLDGVSYLGATRVSGLGI